MQKILSIIFCFFVAGSVFGQISADNPAGCVPLEVNFTGPTLGTYFWDFGDGGGASDEASPNRIYDEPGVYTVELRSGAGGAVAGTTTITVYADPEIMFSVKDDITLGCAPFFVEFTNESIVDPNVPITGYRWTFGDGNSSTLENPTHTYQTEGVFPVSLEIFSSLPECGNIMTFTDYITVSGMVAAGFIVDAIEICDAPATFNITNTTPDDPAYTYEWIFGDGSTPVTDRNPDSHTYSDPGTYRIELNVDNGDGCIVTRIREVRVGGPEFDLLPKDTVCLEINTLFRNNTNAAVFQWSFGTDAFPQTSFQKSPSVQYFATGDKLVTLTATSTTGCISDTTFTINVEDPVPTVTTDPSATCSDPATFVITADNANYASYAWNNEIGGPELIVEYMDNQNWDSFHINRPDTLFYNLSIITQAGCPGFIDTFVVFRDIEAHAIPDVSRGCAPLTVEFDQLSLSVESIIRYDWDFGDGSTISDATGDDQEHTFTEPGEYYVKLIVENDNGCIDTSTGIWIYVGEPLESDFTLDLTEICLFDSVQLSALNLDDRIDAWHFQTDEGRNSDCYLDPTTSHTFVTAPGSYPIKLTVDYNGCFNDIDAGTIEVSGAKTLIQYMTNCDDPYTVMLQDSSFGASNTIWYVEGDTLNTETLPDSILNYTFADTGIYTVYLEAFDNTSACPSNIDSVQIHIVDVHASFAVDSIFCANTEIVLDASSSIGADTRCHKGYTWFTPVTRPRRVSSDSLIQAFIPGPDPDREWPIRLEVEDINGCVDDTTIVVQVYDIVGDFEFDSEKICFPSELVLTDASESDTTLVSWSWSTTGLNDSIVSYLAQAQNDSLYQVQLAVEDALGCVDTLVRQIEVFEITSTPTIAPNPLCVGDSVTLSATDYTEGGSFLNFSWIIENIGSSTNQVYTEVINQSGTYNATLTIEEDASGCTNEYGPLLISVEDYPTAAFAPDLEPGEPVCIGDVVSFINNSTGATNYVWDFGQNGPTSQVENPDISFPTRGTFEVTLFASTNAGCTDSVSIPITTTGPIGTFSIDNDMICKQGEVTFTLLNPEGVESFTWDFGDGETADDVNPITHTYNLTGVTAETVNAKLILRGDDNTCETIQDIDIDLNNIDAVFTADLNTTQCPYFINFSGISPINNDYEYDVKINGQDFTSEFPESFTVLENGQYIITRSVNDPSTNCFDIYSDTIDVVYRDFESSFQLELDTSECLPKYKLIDLSIDGFLTDFNIIGQNNEVVTIDADSILINISEGTTSVTLQSFVPGFETICYDELSINLEEDNRIFNTSFELIADSTECVGIYQVLLGDTHILLDSYQYTDQDGNTLFINDDDLLSVGAGVTIVNLKAFTDGFENTCFAVDSFSIANVVNLKVPNLFTPNGDSNNDILRVVVEGDEFLSSLQCIKTCRFQVFDRWGNEVFSTTDPDLVGWDGMINGSPAPPEMYMYIIETYYYGDPDDDEVNCGTQAEFKKVFKGNVLLQY